MVYILWNQGLISEETSPFDFLDFESPMPQSQSQPEQSQSQPEASPESMITATKTMTPNTAKVDNARLRISSQSAVSAFGCTTASLSKKALRIIRTSCAR